MFSFLRRPSAVVSFIYRPRVGCWVLMATPSELFTEPHGTPRGGKIGKLRISPGIVRIPGSSFVFLTSPHIRGVFVYFGFPRLALVVNGRPHGPPPPRNPTERRNWGIRNRIRNFTDSWISHTDFLPRQPSAAFSFIYHSRVGCSVLMAAPSERTRDPMERQDWEGKGVGYVTTGYTSLE